MTPKRGTPHPQSWRLYPRSAAVILTRHTSRTSYVERQNLTMRMAIRRFTRLTNAFSKKLENLKAAVALHFAYYNFCRVHQTLARHARDGSGNHRPRLDDCRATERA